MEVTFHNNVTQCPNMCVHADMRVRMGLQYGVSKASIVGADVFIS